MKKSSKILSIILIVISSILLFWSAQYPNAGIDLQMHDVYYVVNLNSICVFLSLFLLIKCVMAFVFKEKERFIKWLNILQVVDIILVLLFLYCCYTNSMIGIPRRYYRFDGFQAFGNVERFEYLNEIITISVILFVLNQVFFIVLLLFGIFNRKKPNIEDEILDESQ